MKPSERGVLLMAITFFIGEGGGEGGEGVAAGGEGGEGGGGEGERGGGEGGRWGGRRRWQGGGDGRGGDGGEGFILGRWGRGRGRLSARTRSETTVHLQGSVAIQTMAQRVSEQAAQKTRVLCVGWRVPY